MPENFLRAVLFSQDYTDESGESTDDEKIEIENQYYSSKGLKEEDPRAALLGFQGVLELEEKKMKKEEWGFKALKQMLKLLFKMVCQGWASICEGVEGVGNFM